MRNEHGNGPRGRPADAVWLHQLRAGQGERWSRGERVPVETYLEREPALQADPEALLDLIYSEVLLREERGECPRLEEYLQRFPQHAPSLQRQFDLHQALADASRFDPVAGQSGSCAFPLSGQGTAVPRPMPGLAETLVPANVAALHPN